jgi:hypothetical protein
MGVSDFGGLQEALSEGQVRRLTYFAFDLLHLDGRNLMGLPLVDRKANLEELIGGLRAGSPIRYSEHVVGNGPQFFREACQVGLEGILSKRVRSLYRPGRTTSRTATSPSIYAARARRAVAAAAIGLKRAVQSRPLRVSMHGMPMSTRMAVR